MIRYRTENCVMFYQSREPFGGLSNMAGGYPIQLGEFTIRTSEHLYQAMRYPDHPDVQLAIIDIASPLRAKQYAHQNLHLGRPDWYEIKSDVMAWCLELKACNVSFRTLLETTGKHDIVEASPNDNYWGAVPAGDGMRIGWNTLGRLLWLLRRRLEIALPPDFRTSVIDIPRFRFAGEDAVALAIA